MRAFQQAPASTIQPKQSAPHLVPHGATSQTSRPVLHDIGHIALQPHAHDGLSIGRPDDAHEQQADQVAHRITTSDESRHDVPAIDSRAAAPGLAVVPPLINAALRTRSQPLDPASRAFMEPRFGHDFSKVRVHVDDTAARSADAVAALAYSIGTDIVFARGAYTPTSSRGRQLLAHELTHVVQQATMGTASTVIRRQPKTAVAPPKPTKFYQYIIDEIAEQEADYARQRQEKKYEFMVHKRMNYRALKALLPLAQAVDENRIADIPALVDAFIDVDFGPHPAMSYDLIVELSVRLIMLGLDVEATKLREQYSKRAAMWDWIHRDVGLEQRNLAILSGLVDRIAATADHTTAQSTKATIEQYIRVLVTLRDDMLGMGEFERLHELGIQRWNSMVAVLRRLATAMSISLQALSERAMTELAAGDPNGKATLLLMRELIEARILPALDVTVKDRSIAGIRVVLAATEIKDGKGVIREAFAQNRTVAVRTYTPGQKNVRDVESSLRDVFARRIEQITFLARIYGQTDVLRADRPAEKAEIEDARRNAETLKKVVAAGGTLRLDSDDDWRTFVLQKYRDMTGSGVTDRAKALSAVIKLIFDYLAAFTVHARFTDIYDEGSFKDAYFNRPFPRALSGQLVQDCGVYAMRVAYILSLVRNEPGLDLRFRFIRLPAHIGLVITGDQLPLYIAHNNQFMEVSQEKLQGLRKALEPDAKEGTVTGEATKGTRGAPTPAAATLDDEQFIGEIAAAGFISGSVAMPFALSDVPKTAGTAIDTQKALWTEYQRVAKQDVFGKASTEKTNKNYLFHNRYLAILERYREWHNGALVPFWNENAPKAWRSLDTALRANGRSELSGSELQPLIELQLKQMTDAIRPVDDWLARIVAEQHALSRELRADPRLKATRTRLSLEERIVIGRPWQDALADYRERLEMLAADAAASPAKKFVVAAVIGGLVPPFMPVAEKRFGLVD